MKHKRFVYLFSQQKGTTQSFWHGYSLKDGLRFGWKGIPVFATKYARSGKTVQIKRAVRRGR